MTDEELILIAAEAAYNGYGDKAEWRAYNNEAMPKWEALPQHIKDRWCAAMAAARTLLSTGAR